MTSSENPAKNKRRETRYTTIIEGILPTDDFAKLQKLCNKIRFQQIEKSDRHQTPITEEQWANENMLAEKNNRYPLREIVNTIMQLIMQEKIITGNYGSQYWINFNKQQGYHFDCDETLRQRYEIYRFPSLSTVYYIETPETQDNKQSNGGLKVHETIEEKDEIISIYNQHESKEILCKKGSEVIVPQENSLVIFKPRHPHKVLPWRKGHRTSIAINFWKSAPLEHDHSREDLAKIIACCTDLGTDKIYT